MIQNQNDDQPSEKKLRATVACDNCRKKRIKCVGEAPCIPCRQNKAECVYSTSNKKRGPSSYVDHIKMLEEKLVYCNNRVESLQKLLVHKRPSDPNIEPSSPFEVAPKLPRVSYPISTEPKDDQVFLCNVYIIVGDDVSDTAHYIGNTHSFAVELQQSPWYKNNLSNLPKLSRDNRTLVDIHPSISVGLPISKDLRLFLANIYFDTISVFYPMIDKNEYMKQLQVPFPSDDFVFLEHTMMVLVTQSIEHLDDFGVKSVAGLHLELIKRTRSLIANQLDKASLYNIQAFTLIALTGVSEFEHFNYWVHLGIAIRMAQELGLHRNLSNSNLRNKLSESKLFSFKATWCLLYSLDRVFSLMFGRPVIIREQEMDITNLMLTENNLHPDACPNTRIAFSIVHLLGKINILGNSISNTNKIPEIDNLLNELQMLTSSCPLEFLKMINGEDKSIPWCPIHVIGLYFHLSEILLHRLKSTTYTGRALINLKNLITQVNGGGLRSGIYYSPLLFYSVNILSASIVPHVNIPQNAHILREIMLATSKIEPYFPFAFKSRISLIELLVARNVDPEAVLGPELSIKKPVMSPKPEHDPYMFLYEQQSPSSTYSNGSSGSSESISIKHHPMFALGGDLTLNSNGIVDPFSNTWMNTLFFNDGF